MFYFFDCRKLNPVGLWERDNYIFTVLTNKRSLLILLGGDLRRPYVTNKTIVSLTFTNIMKISVLGKGWIAIIFFIACNPVATAGPYPCRPFSTYVFAALQQQAITGAVSGLQGPLPDITVRLKGVTVYTVTDRNGAFTIPAAIGDTLVFEGIGYQTQEVRISHAELGDIQLSESPTALEEVTINAGYYSVKQKETTGSIARISARDIEKQPVTNMLSAMQGRMAGVSIVQTTGIPGGGFDIRIRGQNSLRSDGNAPLYVIDGVPYSSESIGYNLSATQMPQLTSPLNNINPGDILSIEVLKDADATAIYGSRGANGVILVTTKKARSGDTKFTAAIATGISEVGHFMKLLNTPQYLALRAEAFTNDNIAAYPASAYDINGTWDPNRYTDWQKELIGGTANFTTMQASISGGSPLTRFQVLGNLSKETTVFPGDFAYRKGNVRLNTQHDSQDGKFSASFSAGYTVQGNNQPATDLTSLSRSTAPNAPALYDAQGNLNWENNTFNNPLRVLEGKAGSDTRDLIANTLMAYKIFPGLSVKSLFGYTNLNHAESATSPSTMYSPSFNWGPESSSVFVTTTQRRSWVMEPQLDFTKIVGKAQLNFLAGTTFQKQESSLLAISASGFTSNALIHNLAAASVREVYSDQQEIYKYQAFYGRANLNWDQKYLLNLTARRDGSSRFGPGRQFANFGAVGAAWLFSNEGLFKDRLPAISFGKLRASYGTSGSDQIGNYQFLDTYTASGNSYGGINGLQPSRLYNPDFGWETNKKFETALEAGFFKDRLFLTMAWYRNRSSSQLVGIPLPATTGFSSVQANLGATVENTGIEVTLHVVAFQRKEFEWSANLNLTAPKNRLVSFPGLEGSTYANQYVIGQPLTLRKVYHYTGINPETGLYQFEDLNGDGTINATGDRQVIRDLSPELFGGLQNQLRYKQWSLDVFFQFVKQLNVESFASFSRPGAMVNQPVEVLSHWQSTGGGGPFQQVSSGANSAANTAYSRYIASDAAITDASFVRLKNVQLSYEMPAKWLKGVGCRIALQGQNLWTITPFKGQDPELPSAGFLPPLRTVITSLQLNF
jgi:TonB-dependent starch-binding outer membrane protein SusC